MSSALLLLKHFPDVLSVSLDDPALLGILSGLLCSTIECLTSIFLFLVAPMLATRHYLWAGSSFVNVLISVV